MTKNDPSHALPRDAHEPGHEARAGSRDHAALKLWLRERFDCMAQEHEQWIPALSAGLDEKAVQQPHQQLGTLRVHLARSEPPSGAAAR